MAVKKKTKKAAKKTVPKLRFMTIEELASFMAENHAKTEAAIRDLSIENRKTEETLRETLRSVDRMSVKVDELSWWQGMHIEEEDKLDIERPELCRQW